MLYRRIVCAIAIIPILSVACNERPLPSPSVARSSVPRTAPPKIEPPAIPEPAPPPPSAAFSSTSPKETARWAAEIISPIEKTGANQFVFQDTIGEIQKQFTKITGQKIRWRFPVKQVAVSSDDKQKAVLYLETVDYSCTGFAPHSPFHWWSRPQNPR